jgi:hypothetical protein
MVGKWLRRRRGRNETEGGEKAVTSNQLDAWDDLGYTPLLYAVVAGDLERVREFLVFVTTVNFADVPKDENAIHALRSHEMLLDVSILARVSV